MIDALITIIHTSNKKPSFEIGLKAITVTGWTCWLTELKWAVYISLTALNFPENVCLWKKSQFTITPFERSSLFRKIGGVSFHILSEHAGCWCNVYSSLLLFTTTPQIFRLRRNICVRWNADRVSMNLSTKTACQKMNSLGQFFHLLGC